MANRRRKNKVKQFIKAVQKKVQKIVSKEAKKRRDKIHRYEIPNIGWETSRRIQDDTEKERLSTDSQFRDKFNQGEMTYQSVRQMIDGVRRDHIRAAQHLDDVLEKEISNFGKEKTMMCIGFAPGYMLENAMIALNYNPGDVRHDGAINEIEQILRGEMLTEEQSKDLQDAIDKDEYTDMI